MLTPYFEHNMKNFTDRVDVTLDISLHEYGIVRNPKTNKTIFCDNVTSDFPPKGYEYTYTIDFINVDEVAGALMDMDDGYFSFIGSDLDTELDSLNNDCLAHHIMSMNMYDGHFLT